MSCGGGQCGCDDQPKDSRRIIVPQTEKARKPNPLVGVFGVTIRRVANGYLVQPMEKYNGDAAELGKMMVCETYERLVQVIGEALEAWE